MQLINRDDMLELTRRMTLKRNCFSRIAGAYIDKGGEIEGTFNTHFLKLSTKDQQINLDLAKVIPFSKENEQLKAYHFQTKEETPKSIWQLLMALKDCELKNDALLDVFYELVAETYSAKEPYAIYFLHGTYDIPLKACDKESLWESEEVYKFLICLIAPCSRDYELGEPECGFLFPAFTNRSTDIHGINIYGLQEEKIQAVKTIVFS